MASKSAQNTPEVKAAGTSKASDPFARWLGGIGLLISVINVYCSLLSPPHLHLRSANFMICHMQQATPMSSAVPVIFLNSSVWNDGANTGVIDDVLLLIETPDGHHLPLRTIGTTSASEMACPKLADIQAFRPIAINGKNSQTATFFFFAESGNQFKEGHYRFTVKARISGGTGHKELESRQFTFSPESVADFEAGKTFHGEFDDAWLDRSKERND